MRVIFLEPKKEGNIGFLARVMANFDLNELYLVNPQIGIGIIEKTRAVHAQSVLENIKIVENLNEAIKGLDFVVGTTGIKATSKNVLRRAITPEKFAELSEKCKGRIGILFGREDFGLYNTELEVCDLVVRIPTSEKYGVMNITHAASIIFYELFKRKTPKEKERVNREKEELEKTFKDVISKLDYPKNKEKVVLRSIKNLIGRSFIFKEEARIIIGLMKKINKKLK